MSSEIHKPATPVAPRRNASRLRLSLGAELMCVHGAQRVILRDISQTGAKIQVRKEIAVGQDVELRWGGYDAFGATLWVRNGFCGIEFEQPLEAKTIVEARHLQDSQGLTAEGEAEWVSDKGWSFGKSLI